MGAYSNAIVARHKAQHLSDEQIRTNKNQRTKNRNAARKERNIEIAEARRTDPFTQLKRLDERLGKNVGAKKERKRIAEKISKATVTEGNE